MLIRPIRAALACPRRRGHRAGHRAGSRARRPARRKESAVLLSRKRVLARVGLLAAASGYLAWRAWDARAAGPSLALGWGLMAALALVTAGAAGLSLRRPAARHTLRLGDLAPPDGPEPRTGPPGSQRRGELP